MKKILKQLICLLVVVVCLLEYTVNVYAKQSDVHVDVNIVQSLHKPYDENGVCIHYCIDPIDPKEPIVLPRQTDNVYPLDHNAVAEIPPSEKSVKMTFDFDHPGVYLYRVSTISNTEIETNDRCFNVSIQVKKGDDGLFATSLIKDEETGELFDQIEFDQILVQNMDRVMKQSVPFVKADNRITEQRRIRNGFIFALIVIAVYLLNQYYVKIRLMIDGKNLAGWYRMKDTSINYPIVYQSEHIDHLDAQGKLIYCDQFERGCSNQYCIQLYGLEELTPGIFSQAVHLSDPEYFKSHRLGRIVLNDVYYDVQLFACVRLSKDNEKIAKIMFATHYNDVKDFLCYLRMQASVYYEPFMNDNDRLLVFEVGSSKDAFARDVFVGKISKK